MIGQGVLEKIEAAKNSCATKLDLSSNHITTLPTEIFALTQLTELDLGENQLRTLPAGIGALTQLTELGLYDNLLTTLPPEIGALTQLTELYLGGNQFTTLPTEIWSLTQLTTLYLHENQFTTLPPEMGALTQLTELYLGGNQFTTLPTEIWSFRQLTTLDLCHSQLTTLPPEIGALTQLTRLDLDHNQLTTLPPEIGALTQLTKLYLGGNQFTTLPTEIWSLTQLTTLYLHENQFTTLPPEIGALTRLTELGLYDNQLTTLPPEIGALTQLTTLYLGGNQFTTLPTEIWSLTQLTTLYLHENQFTTLSPEMGALTRLTELGLSDNRLTTLSPEMGALTQLTKLYLDHNQLTSLPPEIGALTQLTALNLRYNQFTILPTEIWSLTQLTTLYLDHNQLTTLPPEMGALTQLTTLYLNENQFTTLPPEIGALTQLTALNLHYNQFTTLPPEMGALTQLTKLYLDNNQFTTLPPEMGALRQLTKLYLDNNQFTTLPPEIWSFRQLTTLDLCHNQLTTLPPEMGALTQLTKLYLGGNQFTTLPPEMGALTQLTKLYLGCNQLTTLPPEMGALRQLTTLYLHNNQLTTLPPEMGALIQLTTLDLCHNQLTTLPPEMGALTQLPLLDVRGNKLVKPPQRVAEEGIEAIRRWFIEEALQGTVENYETKVLLLGSPEVGKTTLRKKIENIDYRLNPNESRTLGVDIFHWGFNLLDGEVMQPAIAHLFDFGGQKIQYMAHQFFISPKAFYILVMNHDINESVVAYWLDCVRTINDDPSILPIYNEFNSQPCIYKVIDTIDHLLPALTMNLNSSNSIILQGCIETIKARISDHILRTKERVLTHWQAIQHELSQRDQPYIAIEEYRSLCVEYSLDNIESQNDLLVDLNKMGHVLYFQNVSSFVFLQPNWLIKALYTLFKPKNDLIKDAYFWKNKLIQAWSNSDNEIDRPAYTGMEQDILFNLLQCGQFNICFQPNRKEERYIVPQYLSGEPRRVAWEHRENKESSIKTIHYRYAFLPMGFIAHVIVQLHPMIAGSESGLCMWQKGVVVQLGNAMALIEERDTYAFDNHISIEIVGLKKDLKDLSSRILSSINNLCDQDYYVYKIEACIPCENCLTVTNSKGHCFCLNDDTIECPACGHIRKTKKGNTTVTNNYNIINNATDGSTIAVAIQGSIQIIRESKAEEEIKSEVETLLKHIAKIAGTIDDVFAKELADESESLSQEVAREEPRKKYLNLSLNGIIETAKKVGELATPVLETAAKISAYFGIA